jgi:recombinational DNA repair protein (RecF pathway)
MPVMTAMFEWQLMDILGISLRTVSNQFCVGLGQLH